MDAKTTFSGCGMCGVIAINGNSNALSSLDMTAMLQTLRFRGPDANGIYKDKGVSLGHTRLSILDLSPNGAQPMTKDDFTITFNGEVYNYPDLRQTLFTAQPNIKLDSTCDTEVVLRLLQQKINAFSGPGFPDLAECINMFNGFYALGLWDSSRRRLLLIRDRFGIKPLYYIRRPGQFLAFASEVETLLASKLFQPKVDLDTLFLFATISSFMSQTEKTLVQDVVSLPAGHYMWIEADTGIVECKPYWNRPGPDPSLANITQAEAVAQMKTLLEDSIQLRMVSDVPVSTFLSGGIDSSVITAICSRSATINSKEAESSNIHSSGEDVHSSNKVTAFTVTYVGDGQNPAASGDEEYARKVSAHLTPERINHKQVPVDPMTFTIDDIDDLSDMGTFSDDDRLLTVLMNYRAVAQNGFRVIINGQGADEAMGGYVGAAWFKMAGVNAQSPDKVLFDNLLDLIIDTKLQTQIVKDRIPQSRDHFKQSWTKYEGEPMYVATQWLFDTSLARILRFEDHLSMRSSVECRVPFLDYRLVEYCFKLPPMLHIRPSDYTGKMVLREVSRSYLPADVSDRPKQAFPNVKPEALNIRLKALILQHLDEIRECPLMKLLWIPSVFATPEGLDQCSGSDYWIIVIYWRWWVKFASYNGTLPEIN